MKFYSAEEVMIAFNEGKIDLHAPIHVKSRVQKKTEPLGRASWKLP